MKREITATASGMSLRLPRDGPLAARLAGLTSGEPWAPEFTRSVFRANFAEDCEIGKPRVIQDRLNALGQSGIM